MTVASGDCCCKVKYIGEKKHEHLAVFCHVVQGFAAVLCTSVGCQCHSQDKISRVLDTCLFVVVPVHALHKQFGRDHSLIGDEHLPDR